MNTKNIIQSEMKVNNLDVLVLKKSIKNYHLNVLPPNGSVRVSVPIRTSDDAIRLFILSRMHWIKKQIKHFDNQPRQTDRQYISGESHYFKGDRYLLDVQENENRVGIKIKNKKYINLYVSESATIAQKEKIFLGWYREELKKEIPDLVQKWEQIIGVQIDDVRVRKMKTKWGTCNITKKRIYLNLELIKKPTHCLEYIIVHELVHLLEEKHTDKFVKYMDKFMPNWKQYKRELNETALSSWSKFKRA